MRPVVPRSVGLRRVYFPVQEDFSRTSGLSFSIVQRLWTAVEIALSSPLATGRSATRYFAINSSTPRRSRFRLSLTSLCLFAERCGRFQAGPDVSSQLSILVLPGQSGPLACRQAERDGATAT